MEQHVSLESANGAGQVVHCSGDWTAATANVLEGELKSLRSRVPDGSALRVNIEKVERLDTIGAWLISRLGNGDGNGHAVVEGGTEQHTRLIERVEASEVKEPIHKPRESLLAAPFVTLGHLVIGASHDFVAANAVQGRILAAFARTVSLQAPLRFASFVQQFEQIVLRAIPIVALISLVVGAIITQQTILQLRNFGAAIFVVDLAAILMFREIGVLLAAIMVAGRSGSAITAEIGSMRMREEFDALKVMGVDPYQALILPRVVALVVGMPLLAFVGSMAGLAGAMLVARFYADIPLNVFLGRLQTAMTPTSLIVGMIKAPFMAFLVGLIAAIEGMKVEGSSESLGKHTTSSVVKAIFVVIVADGLFAIFFAAIRL